MYCSLASTNCKSKRGLVQCFGNYPEIGDLQAASIQKFAPVITQTMTQDSIAQEIQMYKSIKIGCVGHASGGGLANAFANAPRHESYSGWGGVADGASSSDRRLSLGDQASFDAALEQYLERRGPSPSVASFLRWQRQQASATGAAPAPPGSKTGPLYPTPVRR